MFIQQPSVALLSHFHGCPELQGGVVWWGPTLHGGLRAQTRQRTHGADHEVRQQLGAVLISSGLLVVAERGDLGAALALEGALEGGRRGVAGLHGDAARPRNGQRVLGP
jgi:hypothetical protein